MWYPYLVEQVLSKIYFSDDYFLFNQYGHSSGTLSLHIHIFVMKKWMYRGISKAILSRPHPQ